MARRAVLFGLRSRVFVLSDVKGFVRSGHGITSSTGCKFYHSVTRSRPAAACLEFQKYRCKSTRILSDEFGEDSTKVEEEEFFVDPVTRRVTSRSKGDFNEKAEANDELFYDTRTKYSRQNQGGKYTRYDSRDRRWSPRRGSTDGEDFGYGGTEQGYRDKFERGPQQYGRRDQHYGDEFERGPQQYGRRDQHHGDEFGRGSIEDLWNKLNEKKVDFSGEPAIEKNFYTEHPDVLNRPEEEVREFMKTHQMAIRGPNVKKPILKFEESGFADEIMEILKKMNFDQPTPIQSVGWPHALSGSDLVGIAQTGSGKTLSFMLPAIEHVREQRKNVKSGGPIALVMCPTRELAMQCHSVVSRFSRLCRVRSAVVYGGQSKIVQEDRLSQPALDIAIATPGRLLDFLTAGIVSLKHCTYLVLDEADRMLDMGFEPQIRSIMGQIRPDRQVLMWSATWPEEIQDLATDFLGDYVHVKIGSQKRTVNPNVTQTFETCSPTERMSLLLDHLMQNRDERVPKKPAKTLVFASTRVTCERVGRMLRGEGIRAGSLHGGKTQRWRDEVMHNFRTGRINVLVASDIAARGLDVTDIEYVVNYDMPQNIDDYIHRVGRTARAGRNGTSITFITMDDLDMIEPLVRLLEDADHEVPEILYELAQKRNQLKAYRKRDRVSQNYEGRKPSGFRY